MKSIFPIIFLAFMGCNQSVAITHTIAISYFDNTSGLEEYNPLSKGLADMLITDLSNVKSIRIVEREKLESLLKEIELGEGKFMDESTAQKLGKGLGAGYMLTGSYLIMGETMRINTRLINVGTGEVSMGEEITGEKNAFFELEKDLVEKLISSLNLSLSKSEERRVKKVQTESFESFNAYSTALDSYDKGEYEESQAYLEKAVEIDEDFEIAWDRLDELEKYLEDMLLSRSLGLGEYYINLINSLDFNDPNSCNDFTFEILWGQLINHRLYQNGLFQDLYQYSINGTPMQHDETQWILAGFNKKYNDFEECIIEYGLLKTQIFNFYDRIIFSNYPDNKCGRIHPKEVSLHLILTEITLLKNNYFFTGIAINKDGEVFYNLNDPLGVYGGNDAFIKVGDEATHYYNKQFIKYGELLYKKFPNTIYTNHFDFLQQAIKLEK